MYQNYMVLKDFVLPNGSIASQGDRLNFGNGAYILYKSSEDFINTLVLNGFLRPVNDPSFGVIATSKLAGVEIADKDYTEGDKKYFTYDEALEVEKNLEDGWRLPTRHEWALICEEFACNDEGRLDAKLLTDVLGLGLNGWVGTSGEEHDVGSEGNYWSSTTTSAGRAYSLTFNISTVYPSNNSNRYLGFPLRCVRDLHKESNDE